MGAEGFRPRWTGLGRGPAEFVGRIENAQWEQRFACSAERKEPGMCSWRPWAQEVGPVCPSCGSDGEMVMEFRLRLAAQERDARIDQRYTYEDDPESEWGAFTAHLAKAGVDLAELEAEPSGRSLVGREFLWRMTDIQAGRFRAKDARMPFRAQSAVTVVAPPKGGLSGKDTLSVVSVAQPPVASLLSAVSAAAQAPSRGVQRSAGLEEPEHHPLVEAKPAPEAPSGAKSQASSSSPDFAAIDARLVKGATLAEIQEMCEGARISRKQWEAHAASLGPRLAKQEDGRHVLRAQPRGTTRKAGAEGEWQ